MYFALFQKHGLLVAVVIILGGLLAATNADMLRHFESVKFGPVEAKLRVLTLKGRSGRETDARRVGEKTHQLETLEHWLSVTRAPSKNIFMEKAKLLVQIAGSDELGRIEQFDEFRREVVTPIAYLDAALQEHRVELFERSQAATHMLHNAMESTIPSNPEAKRTVLFCQALDGLHEIVESLPSWAKDIRPNSEDILAAYGKDAKIDAMAREAAESVRSWASRCRDDKSKDTIINIIDSPYFIIIIDTLIRKISMNEGANNIATIYYMNLFGSKNILYPNDEMETRNYDLTSKAILISLINRAAADVLPLDKTHKMLLDHYMELESFTQRVFGAPTERHRKYRPCDLETLGGPIDIDTGLSPRIVCERVELVTIPVALNGSLFAIAETWLRGGRVEAGPLNVSERLLGRAEPRLEMLLDHLSGKPADPVFARVHYGLLDTVALTQLMHAVVFNGKPTPNQCRTILARFRDVQSFFETAAAAQAAEYSISELGRLETLEAVLRRQEVARSYCEEE
jgi:hypothetical protein